MKITAILAIRNEEKYLRVILKQLVDSDIRLAILDNESTDQTKAILEEFEQYTDYHETIPYLGRFNLTKQIEAKSRIIQKLETDWVIHQDADEILQSPLANENLREGIERVASEGCTAINFDEFVFVPTKEQPAYHHNSFYEQMLDYYFFELKPLRLMRAWKYEPEVIQCEGGHRLKSNTPLVFPSDSFILRHYIVLDHEHAYQKYAHREFADEDLVKGWHANRTNFPTNVVFPGKSDLNRLDNYRSKKFSKEMPCKKHFWEVNQPEPVSKLIEAGD